jgi:REP element-mobilizing transposase RayT
VSGRKSLPHDPPLWIDPADHIWMITVNALPRGSAQLTVPAIAEAIIGAVEFYWKSHKWYPWIFCVMADHCHGLFSFPRDTPGWKSTVRNWKHWLAAKHHIHWQTDFHDHRLREDESFSEKAEYILQNPVVEGLVARAEDWPYVWRPPDGMPFTGMPR